MKINGKLAFIGVGFMAGAMIDGILAAGLIAPEDIYCINDAFPDVARSAAETHGISYRTGESIAECDTVVFGIKPQVLPEALEMYSEQLTADKLYFSIMAGISTARLEDALGGARIVRFMPNMPLSVGCSATVYALGSACGEAEALLAETVFAPLGKIRRVDESMISAYTALSGSGPAYICRMVEAMAHAAVALGIPEDAAEEFAVQTLVGTARVIDQNGISPAEFRTRVTSKKGTTEAALLSLDESGFDEAVAECMKACLRRSDELAKA